MFYPITRIACNDADGSATDWFVRQFLPQDFVTHFDRNPGYGNAMSSNCRFAASKVPLTFTPIKKISGAATNSHANCETNHYDAS